MPSQTLFFPVIDDDRILEVASSLTGGPVSSVERRMGGGNNRLFRVTTTDQRAYALKEYPRRAGDARDRLGAEFGALQFLDQCGIGNVPKADCRGSHEGLRAI